MDHDKDILIKTHLYEICAKICERINFVKSWIRSEDKYKKLISGLFYREDCQAKIMSAIIYWGTVLIGEAERLRDRIAQQPEFQEVKKVLSIEGYDEGYIYRTVLALCVLKHALEGISCVIKGKKLDFGLIVVEQ